MGCTRSHGTGRGYKPGGDHPPGCHRIIKGHKMNDYHQELNKRIQQYDRDNKDRDDYAKGFIDGLKAALWLFDAHNPGPIETRDK